MCACVFCVRSCSHFSISCFIFERVPRLLHWRRGIVMFPRPCHPLVKSNRLNPTQETFPRYVKRIKNFFSANEVADAKQKYVFLNSLGRKHYNLLSNLLSPAEPEDKSLDELITVLTKHFQPTTSVIAERYSFHCRCQIPNERIADFVVGLKKSITSCQY